MGLYSVGDQSTRSSIERYEFVIVWVDDPSNGNEVLVADWLIGRDIDCCIIFVLEALVVAVLDSSNGDEVLVADWLIAVYTVYCIDCFID